VTLELPKRPSVEWSRVKRLADLEVTQPPGDACQEATHGVTAGVRGSEGKRHDGVLGFIGRPFGAMLKGLVFTGIAAAMPCAVVLFVA
jgi:hypothetical protein